MFIYPLHSDKYLRHRRLVRGKQLIVMAGMENHVLDVFYTIPAITRSPSSGLK
jgi:hypothetical protein